VNGTTGAKVATLRGQGQEPSRWHWAYGGTCFRLNQRVQSEAGRPMILSRGYVMTRGGVEALKEQLWAEAMRRGLGRANEVLIVADGAVWDLGTWLATAFPVLGSEWTFTTSANTCGPWPTRCIRMTRWQRAPGSNRC